MDREVAAEAFAKMLFRVGVEQSVKAFFDSLNRPGGEDKATWQAAKAWYEGEDSEVKARIEFMIKEAVILSAFGIAVNFDGASEYSYIGSRPAGFVVSINVYDDEDSTDTDIPQETVKICPATGGSDIHDLLLDLVDEKKRS